MTARPITEGERVESLEAARAIVAALDADPGEGLTEAGSMIVQIARALLSTSSEVRRLREIAERYKNGLERQATHLEFAPLAPDETPVERYFKAREVAGELALVAAALSVEVEDELARATPSAPISTDTKDTTK